MLGTTPKARFGSFQFDFASQILSKNGSPVPLSASQTRLLTLFLTSRGVLLTRDEIASHLWKDSRNINVSNGINSAVNRLRYILNDDTARPAYIETVIGLGYRFIAPVEQVYPDEAGSAGKAKASVPEEDWSLDARRAGDRPAALDAPRSETKPNSQPESLGLAESVGRQKPGRRFRNAAVFATPAIIAAILAAALVYRSSRKAGDGSSGPPPTGTFYPVTFNDSDDKVTAEAISPGGDKVAYADRSGVSIAWIDSRATQLLASPAAFRGRRIDWYPDGQHLALSGMTENTHRQQVWQLSPDGSQPTLIADDADLAAVSPDGGSIAMTVHGDTEIDIAPAAGGAPRRLLKAGEKERFVFLLWARSGRYLIAERFNEGRLPDSRSTTPSGDIDSLKRWHYEAVDCNSGRLFASQENIRFDSGYILADGRLVYPEALSIWPTQTNLNMLRTDPSDGRVLSPAAILQTTYGDQPRALTASTNGQRIAVILDRTTSDVFAGSLHFPGPVLDGAIQLTHRSYESYPHAWSANDDRILLENNNVGLAAIFEQRLDRATPDLVARLPIDAAMAEFSPDGQWILFLGLDPVPRGSLVPSFVCPWRVEFRSSCTSTARSRNSIARPIKPADASCARPSKGRNSSITRSTPSRAWERNLHARPGCQVCWGTGPFHPTAPPPPLPATITSFPQSTFSACSTLAENSTTCPWTASASHWMPTGRQTARACLWKPRQSRATTCFTSISKVTRRFCANQARRYGAFPHTTGGGSHFPTSRCAHPCSPRKSAITDSRLLW